MRRWRAKTVLTAILAGIAWVPPSSVSADGRDRVVVDRIVAVVDTIPITLVELKNKSAATVAPSNTATLGERIDAERAAERRALGDLIDDRVLDLVAAANSLTVTDAEIDAAIASIMKAGELTPQALDDALKASGWSHEAYRAAVQRQVLRGKIVQLKVVPKLRNAPAMTPQAYSAALDTGLRAFLDGERVNHFIEDRL
jgi:parvulin-like peptidyl-prolyl isomerase